VPKDQVIKYEAALKADKYLLVVHGSAEDQAKAREVLADANTAVAA
jgi:cyanophycinase-like exopeptidase